MSKPIKLMFSVEFQVNPEEGLGKVLARVAVVRSLVAKLGFSRVGALVMATPSREPDGLLAALTEEH